MSLNRRDLLKIGGTAAVGSALGVVGVRYFYPSSPGMEVYDPDEHLERALALSAEGEHGKAAESMRNYLHSSFQDGVHPYSDQRALDFYRTLVEETGFGDEASVFSAARSAANYTDFMDDLRGSLRDREHERAHLFGRIAATKILNSRIPVSVKKKRLAGLMRYMGPREMLDITGGIYVFDPVTNFKRSLAREIMNGIENRGVNVYGTPAELAINIGLDYALGTFPTEKFAYGLAMHGISRLQHDPDFVPPSEVRNALGQPVDMDRVVIDPLSGSYMHILEPAEPYNWWDDAKRRTGQRPAGRREPRESLTPEQRRFAEFYDAMDQRAYGATMRADVARRHAMRGLEQARQNFERTNAEIEEVLRGAHQRGEDGLREVARFMEGLIEPRRSRRE